MKIKKFVGKKWKEWKKEHKERVKYKKELTSAVKKVQRKAFLDASITEAKKKTQRSAKLIYAPKKKKSFKAGGVTKPTQVSKEFHDLLWKS